MVAIDGEVVTLVEVVVGDRFRLVVIDGDTMADRVEVIVGTSAHLTSLDEALDEQLLVDHEVDHQRIHVVFPEQLRQRLSLGNSTRITVQDDTLAVLGQGAQVVVDHAVHHIVGHEIATRDKGVDMHAQFATGCYLGTKHIAGREVLQAEFIC